LRFFGLILESIFMVFWGSSCREMAKKQKSDKKKSMGKDDWKTKNPQLFRPKAFDMDYGFPPKRFVVFLNSPC
jgi:hypothetical protein